MALFGIIDYLLSVELSILLHTKTVEPSYSLGQKGFDNEIFQQKATKL